MGTRSAGTRLLVRLPFTLSLSRHRIGVSPFRSGETLRVSLLFSATYPILNEVLVIPKPPSAPQAVNGRFAAVISRPRAPGSGRTPPSNGNPGAATAQF